MHPPTPDPPPPPHPPRLRLRWAAHRRWKPLPRPVSCCGTRLRRSSSPVPSPTRTSSSPNRPHRRRAMDAQPAPTTKPSRKHQIRHPGARIYTLAWRISPGAGCFGLPTLRSCVGELLLLARPLHRAVPRSTTAAALPPPKRQGNGALTPGGRRIRARSGARVSTPPWPLALLRWSLAGPLRSAGGGQSDAPHPRDMTDDKTDAAAHLQAAQQPPCRHSSRPRRVAALTALGATTARRSAVTRCAASAVAARGTAPASAANHPGPPRAGEILRRLRPLHHPLHHRRRP
jgi:hypothetical protein